MAPQEDFDLIIVGGGLAGASLAAALADSPLRLALLDPTPPQLPSGWPETLDSRIYALTPASTAFLQQIGLMATLASGRLSPILRMRVSGDNGGQLNFSAYEAAVANLGQIAEAAPLAAALWEKLRRQSNLRLLTATRPTGFRREDGRALLTLANGDEIGARLLVAADGRDSWLRQAAGLKANEHAYGECGVIANFACSRPHRQTAFQWFRPDGVLAWLPLPGERISIVWSTAAAHAAELCALPAADFAARVAAAGQDTLGRLELLNTPQALPLRLIRVPQTVAPRLALLGDAAHGIHPLSGHGINLGFMDARELAARLLAAPAGEDIGALPFLNGYQYARWTETRLLQEGTHTLHELFASRLPGLATLRNLGLDLTARLPVVKTLLMRYALGA